MAIREPPERFEGFRWYVSYVDRFHTDIIVVSYIGVTSWQLPGSGFEDNDSDMVRRH